MNYRVFGLHGLFCFILSAIGTSAEPDHISGTNPWSLQGDPADAMITGIDKFLLDQLNSTKSNETNDGRRLPKRFLRTKIAKISFVSNLKSAWECETISQRNLISKSWNAWGENKSIQARQLSSLCGAMGSL